MNLLTQLLLFNVQYIPHGHCYLWQTPLVALHVTADAFIAVAYYSIPIFLIYFVRKVENLPFKNIFILFGAFILSCGTTHLAEIWTLWHPNYWIYGILKAITALVSLYTALSLIPLIPKALNLPSPQELANLNQQLNEQIMAKETAREKVVLLNQQLEERVQEKTTALIKANQDLQESTEFREKLIDLTPNILYIYDLVTNRNIYCNPFITDLLGYTPLELQKFRDGLLDRLIHPEDLVAVKQQFNECLLLKNDNYLELEYRIKNTQGQWYWLHDKITIFTRDADGSPEQILGIARDITQTKELNQKLEEQILALEKTNQARIKLTEMNEFIQACASIDEAKEVLADLLRPLFPNTHGAVYLMNNSKNLLDAIAAWGIPHSDGNFDPKECWAIRRGNPHQVHPQTSGLYCSHIDAKATLKPSLCLPMIAERGIIGMLYLRFDYLDAISQSVQDLAETIAQNLAISFANLKLQEKLRFQSLRDPLTGLYNRRYLQETLTKEINRAQRKKQFVSVLMIDVDYFKRFNDNHGHSAGDLVLSQLGTYLISQIRQYDIACRYGGEELVIVMPDASIEDTIIRAEEIRAGVKKLKLEHEGEQLDSISVSIGVSYFPDDSNSVYGLIQAADKALYKAKEQGRDCVRRP
ncbi:MAG TPA: diguanylate cyclase [Coleofasciculaceae cyanobacterium]|jgi:diguanylate cyclase (GGDEF)-like protein/PAS domain S-box-containing protein